MKKSGNKTAGEDKANEQIRTSTPNGGTPDRNPQRTGKPKRHDRQPRIEMAADGTHVHTQRLTTAKGTCRLRVDWHGATHRQAVIVRPGKGNEVKNAEWEMAEAGLIRQTAVCLAQMAGFIKGRRCSQKRKYKRDPGTSETG